MNFPARELTDQYISLSYQDVLQQYYPVGDDTFHMLDGLGNEILTFPSIYYGDSIITSGQTSSMSVLSASYAVSASYEIVYETSSSYAETSSVAISASWAPQMPSSVAVSASWASASFSSSYAETANIAYVADVAVLADTASIAVYSESALSASWASASFSSSYAISASYADNVSTIIDSRTFAFEFIYKTGTDATDPGNKNYKLDNTDSASITNIYLSSITNNGLDISSVIRKIGVNQKLYIQDKADATKAFLFSLSSSSIDQTSWFTLPVALVSSPGGGFPTNNKASIFILLNETTVTTGSTYPVTASWAVSASWAPDVIVTVESASWASASLSSSYSETASWAPNLYPQTYQESGSWASSSFSSSYALSASWAPDVTVTVDSASWASASFSSSYAESASYVPDLYPQTYQESASWSSASFSSSYAESASYVPDLYPQTYQESASWASASFSSSYAESASYVPNLYPQTEQVSASWASHSLSTVSASWASASFSSSYAETASFSISASWAPDVTVTVESASWASASISSSYADTASYVSNLYPQTYQESGSWASASFSSSYAETASWAPDLYPQVYQESGSWASASFSSSYAPVEPNYSESVSTYFGTKQDTLVTGNTYTITASWANNAKSASYPLSESSNKIYYQGELINFGALRKDPTGFPNRTDTVLSFNDNTKVFSITGTNFAVYSAGKEYIKSTETVDLSAAATGSLYRIYYAAGTLAISSTVGSWDIESTNVSIGTVYWDGTKGIIGDERHGIQMDGKTQEYLHETMGPRYANGLTLTHTGSNPSFTVSDGEFYDDDNEYVTLEQSMSRIIWHSGSTLMVSTNVQPRLWMTSSTGDLAYDNLTTSASVTAGRHVAYWLYAVNGLDGDRLMSVMGQRQDTTLANAQANNVPQNLVFGTFPLDEAKLLYRVIYDSNGNIEDTTDYRQSQFGGSNYTATDHGTLAGLADDDHAQYLNLNGRTGGQSVTGGITASLQGTSSWANNSVTAVAATSASYASASTSASYAPVEPDYSSSVSSQFGTKQDTLVVGGHYTITASWASSSIVSVSASWASSSLATVSASWASASLATVSSSWASHSLSTVSASWASASLATVSASWASHSLSAVSASWSSASLMTVSASWASHSLSTVSSSWASHSLSTVSASWASASLATVSSSWASASFSSSYANTSSVAISASWAPATPSDVAESASWASSSLSSSYPWQTGDSGSIYYHSGSVLIGTNTNNLQGDMLQISQSVTSSGTDNYWGINVYSTSSQGIRIATYENIYGNTSNLSLINLSGIDPDTNTPWRWNYVIYNDGHFAFNRDGTGDQLTLDISGTLGGSKLNFGGGNFIVDENGNTTSSFLIGTASWAGLASWAPATPSDTAVSASWASASLSASYVNGFVYGTQYAEFTAPIDENEELGYPRVFIGVTGETPRVIFEPSGSDVYDNWQIDAGGGSFRIFQPGIVKFYITSTGDANLSRDFSASNFRANADGTGMFFGTASYAPTNPTSLTTFTPVTSIDYTVDFNNPYYTVLPTDSDLNFSSSVNGSAVKSSTIYIQATESIHRNIYVNSEWKFVGSIPVILSASLIGVLSLTSFGPTESDVVAAWGISGSGVGSSETSLTTGSTYPVTASWAEQSLVAVSASWASHSLSTVSASWASRSLVTVSASWASHSLSTVSASWASASFAFTASQGIRIGPSTDATASFYISGSPTTQLVEMDISTGEEVFTVSQTGRTFIATASITGSLFGTSSWAASAATAAVMTPYFSYNTVATSSTNWITCSFLLANQVVNLTTALLYSFTSSNHPAAGQMSDITVYLNNTATLTSSLAWPATWKCINGAFPCCITASKVAMVSLRAIDAGTVIGSVGLQL